MSGEEWSERQVQLDLKREKAENHINKFDGLVHAAHGKLIDPSDGHTINKAMQDTSELQTKFDIFDDNYESDQNLSKERKSLMINGKDYDLAEFKVDRWGNFIDPETNDWVADPSALQYDGSGVVLQFTNNL